MGRYWDFFSSPSVSLFILLLKITLIITIHLCLPYYCSVTVFFGFRFSFRSKLFYLLSFSLSPTSFPPSFLLTLIPRDLLLSSMTPFSFHSEDIQDKHRSLFLVRLNPNVRCIEYVILREKLTSFLKSNKYRQINSETTMSKMYNS